MCPPKAPKVGLGFVLIFHFPVPRSPFPVPRSPFLVLVTFRLTVVRFEEAANIQTIQANFVWVNEKKN